MHLDSRGSRADPTSKVRHGNRGSTTGRETTLGKKIVQLLLCVLHPVAVVLIWYQLAFRRDDWAFTRMAWAVVVIIPLVPFIYVLTGNDFI
jgi:hypothetical protein